MSVITTLLGGLATPAVLFLVYRMFSGGTMFSRELDAWLVRGAVNILALAVVAFLSEASGRLAWWWLALVAPLLTALSVFRDSIARSYRKRTGKASFEGGWVCKKCGAENGDIMILCVECEGERAGG